MTRLVKPCTDKAPLLERNGKDFHIPNENIRHIIRVAAHLSHIHRPFLFLEDLFDSNTRIPVVLREKCSQLVQIELEVGIGLAVDIPSFAADTFVDFGMGKPAVAETQQNSAESPAGDSVGTFAGVEDFVARPVGFVGIQSFEENLAGGFVEILVGFGGFVGSLVSLGRIGEMLAEIEGVVGMGFADFG